MLSDDNDGDPKTGSPYPYSSLFQEQLPYFLSIGMTPEQYWDGDNDLTRAYYKAEKIRLERLNQQLWLQGRYIYDALLCASPVLRSFSKKPKPLDYPNEPYDFNGDKGEEKKESKAKVEFDKGMRLMTTLMQNVNRKRDINNGRSDNRESPNRD